MRTHLHLHCRLVHNLRSTHKAPGTNHQPRKTYARHLDTDLKHHPAIPYSRPITKTHLQVKEKPLTKSSQLANCPCKFHPPTFPSVQPTTTPAFHSIPAHALCVSTAKVAATTPTRSKSTRLTSASIGHGKRTARDVANQDSPKTRPVLQIVVVRSHSSASLSSHMAGAASALNSLVRGGIRLASRRRLGHRSPILGLVGL